MLTWIKWKIWYVEKLGTELRSGFFFTLSIGTHMELIEFHMEKLKPAYENLMGLFHAIDWKEPWLICLVSFHALFLLVAFTSRKDINIQLSLFLLALGGVYLAERLNSFLAGNLTSFASQNYFDTQGLFLSVLWSGPLLVIVILILVNTLFSLCQLIVGWKRAQLRHRTRVAITKED